ncbi:alpha-L-fucosidase [Herbiconiux sp. P17]|uniref:alpha-L-fucosidase n=1 Tax=Herbiconiux wuyangfengii TaxID=3342794 RepID=UPI0035BA61E0
MTSSAITTYDTRLTAVRPSERQLAWQAMEFYAFIHFGMNSMTDREWGLGHEDPALFDPSALDVDQWMRALASAGMTGAIITAKHHDGFCLWPSRVTTHSVASSPWRNGEGDLLRELADSAARHGLKLGIYLSPWDRTEPSYGTGTSYDDFFVAQLEEVLSDYGPVFSVWFDGANGEGANGRVQEYDWERYYATIRRLQPDAVISVCGPDVRWCGNEAGHTRPNEWSVVPALLRDIERIADKSQQVDDGEFSRAVHSDDDDLGSRAALDGHMAELVWYPAEVNTSIRPGWFYHRSEDAQVRTGEQLFELWCDAVGGNATLLLNLPPDERGLLAAPDVEALADLGRRIAEFTGRVLPAHPVVSSGALESSDGRQRPVAAELIRAFGSGLADEAWRPESGDETPEIRLELAPGSSVDAIVLRERIALGQRLERVLVHGIRGDDEVLLAETEAVGYQRILRFDPVAVDAVRVRIEAARGRPALQSVVALGVTGAR